MDKHLDQCVYFHTILTGTGQVFKSGSGRFHIVGSSRKGEPNTFGSIMTIESGPLSIQLPESLGSTSGRTEVQEDGALELRPTAATTYTAMNRYGCRAWALPTTAP
jgi:hypothetical protein